LKEYLEKTIHFVYMFRDRLQDSYALKALLTTGFHPFPSSCDSSLPDWTFLQ
jgi:hypothetical protein